MYDTSLIKLVILLQFTSWYFANLVKLSKIWCLLLTHELTLSLWDWKLQLHWNVKYNKSIKTMEGHQYIFLDQLGCWVIWGLWNYWSFIIIKSILHVFVHYVLHKTIIWRWGYHPHNWYSICFKLSNYINCMKY